MTVIAYALRRFRLLALVFTLSTSLSAWAKEAERSVVRMEENSRGKKTITEVYRGTELVRTEVLEKRTGARALDARYLRFFQGGQEVLFEYWDSKSKETIRYFSRDKHTIMAEVDTDGDSFFEWLFILGKDGKVATVFKRDKQGKAEMLADSEFDTLKKGSDAAKELLVR